MVRAVVRLAHVVHRAWVGLLVCRSQSSRLIGWLGLCRNQSSRLIGWLGSGSDLRQLKRLMT